MPSRMIELQFFFHGSFVNIFDSSYTECQLIYIVSRKQQLLATGEERFFQAILTLTKPVGTIVPITPWHSPEGPKKELDLVTPVMFDTKQEECRGVPTTATYIPTGFSGVEDSTETIKSIFTCHQQLPLS